MDAGAGRTVGGMRGPDMNIYAVIGVILLVWSLVAFVPAVLARSKGRSFAAWWGLGMLIGVFAVIPAAMMPTYRCPSCREVIAPDATICSHCRQPVPHRSAQTVTRVQLQPEPALFSGLAVFVVLVVAGTAYGIIKASAMPIAGTAAVVAGLVLTASAALAIGASVMLPRA